MPVNAGTWQELKKQKRIGTNTMLEQTVQQKHIDGMSKTGFDFVATIKAGINKPCKSAQYAKTGRKIDDKINLALLAGQGYAEHIILETKDRAQDKSRPVTLIVFVGGISKCFYTAYVQTDLKGKSKDVESVSPTNANNNRRKPEPVKTGFTLADLAATVESKVTVSEVKTAKNAIKKADIDALKKGVLDYIDAYVDALNK